MGTSVGERLDDAYVGGAVAAYRAVWSGGLREDPLSGEWAGDTTPADVRDTYDPNDECDDDWTVVDAWEAGYADVANGVHGEPDEHDADDFVEIVRGHLSRQREL